MILAFARSDPPMATTGVEAVQMPAKPAFKATTFMMIGAYVSSFWAIVIYCLA